MLVGDIPTARGYAFGRAVLRLRASDERSAGGRTRRGHWVFAEVGDALLGPLIPLLSNVTNTIRTLRGEDHLRIITRGKR